jgi:uncharacterized sulfatase
MYLLFYSLIGHSSAKQVFWNTSLPMFFLLHIFIYLIIFSFCFLSKKGKTVSIIINVVFSFLFLVDLTYARAFDTPISAFSLLALGNIGSVFFSAIELLHLVDILFFIDIPFSLYLMKKGVRLEESLLKVFIATFSFSLLGIMLTSLLLISGIINFSFVVTERSPIRLINTFSVIGYHSIDLLNFFRNQNASLISKQEREYVEKWLEDNKKLNEKNEQTSPYKGKFKGKNLIFIQFEALENCVINRRINEQEITPTLNRLIKKGIYFSNLKQQVKEGNSSDAEFMALTSLFPTEKGSLYLRYPLRNYNGLPKILKKEGYISASFIGMESSFMNMHLVYPSLGFDKFYSLSDYNFKRKISLGGSDEEFFEQSFGFIKDLPQPFFSHLLNISSHTPFILPEDLRNEALVQGIHNEKVKDYIQAVHYADKCLEEFLKRLESEGLLKNTVVVVYGDHEGINRYYPEEVEKSSIPWLKNNMNVPFIIYHDSLLPKEIKNIGGQIDILPTVLYIMGVNNSKYQIGRNLLTSKEDFVISAYGDYITTRKIDPEIVKFRLQSWKISEEFIEGVLKDRRRLDN